MHLHFVTSRRDNCWPSPEIDWRLRTKKHSTSTNSALGRSKLITHCRSRFRGAREKPPFQPRCTWAEAWKRLRTLKKRCLRGASPNGLSCCWRSPVFLTQHAHRRESTRHG